MKLFYNVIALGLSVSHLSLLSVARNQNDAAPISRELTDVDYPEFRFKNWDMLTSDEKEILGILDYSLSTWSSPGTAAVERKRFSELPADVKGAAEDLGFTEKQWDCYQNHYSSYTWSELIDENLSEFFIRLGWTRVAWEDRVDEAPDSQLKKEWKALTSNEQIAARELCYFQETWNKVNFDEWECRKEHYLDYTWEELKEDGIDQLFAVLGWTEAKWKGLEDPPATASQDWDELTVEQHVAARKLCFVKDEWNGPAYPTFRYRAWKYLTADEQSNAEILSYTETSWNNIQTLDTEAYTFAELSETEKQAALDLGYDQEVWDCYVNHYSGYTWQGLNAAGVQHWLVILGWDSTTWKDGANPPNTEIQKWDDLSIAQKTAAKELCFIEESWNNVPLNDWECAKDNFYDKTWYELKKINVQQYFLTLGWDEQSWMDGNFPATESKDWDALTKEEAVAATAVCFEKEKWDGPKDFYPAKRYHVWDLLDLETQTAAGVLTYTKDSWNSLGSSHIEDLSFDELSTEQQVAAQKLGFEEDTWDCWQNHYYAYVWDDLEDLNQVANFQVLGWTEESWTTGNTPEVWEKDWSDLTSAQRDAATKLCYFSETWKKTNLEEWECPKKHFADLSWDGMKEAGVQRYFETLGWTEESWDGPGTPPPTEDMHWDDMSLEQHVAAMQICFTKSEWDSAFAPVPSPTSPVPSPTSPVPSPTSPVPSPTNPVPSPTSPVSNPTDPVPSPTPPPPTPPPPTPPPPTPPPPTPPDANNEVPIYPDFRFRTWEALSAGLMGYATALSYDEDKWNTPGTSNIENLPFKLLTDGQQHAAIQLGFRNEVSWNCYMNHYLGFTWDELEEEGVQSYYVVLGYTAEEWADNSKKTTKSSWDELNGAEQTAAKKLCYIKESWDGVPLDEWECSWNHFTGRSWAELKEIGMQHYFVALGWDESAWNTGENPPETENKKWDELTKDEEVAARAICFQKESWNDPSKWYPMLRYKLWDLLENDVQEAAERLAYDKESWNNPGTAAVEHLGYNELSEVQKDAVSVLEFKEGDWDCWQNHYHAYTWKELEEFGVNYFLDIFGWNAISWNSYIQDFDVTKGPDPWNMEWDVLDDRERNAAAALCYIEQTWDKLDLNEWDCTKNHYDGYTWAGLDDVGVQGYFVTLGWTEQSWVGKSDPPKSQSEHWTELTEEERTAARQLCYSKSVWESYFNEKVNGGDGGGKNIAGVIGGVLASVAFVGLVGGMHIYGVNFGKVGKVAKKAVSKKEDEAPHTIPNDVAVQV